MDQPIHLMLGDSVDKLKKLLDNSIDSIVTDPPYALIQSSRNGSAQSGDMGSSSPSKLRGFMGHEWDNGAVAFDPNFWKECLRVLKPGGHLLAFGGSRTYHRLATAIEDGGFEIRDQIMWLYGCLSDDTQCLTKAGWKPYTALSTDDEVLQWNPQTEELSWTLPEAIHVYPYFGEMVRLKNRHTDQLLTPNHRVFAKVRWHSRNSAPTDFSVFQASELRPHWKIDLPVAGLLKSGCRVPRAYLVGSWLTDAWKHADGKVAMFSQSKPRTLQKLRAALGPYSPSEYTKPVRKKNHNEEHTFYVSGELAKYLLSEFPDRELTWDVLSWDQESRSALVEGLLDGDGSLPAGQYSMVFWSKNANRLDVFQALCLSLGYRAYIDYRKGCVYLNRRTTTQTSARHREEPVVYEGSVWCLTVPTGAFVVRRNGRAFITGNSGFPKSLDVSKAIDGKVLYGGSNTKRLKEVNKSRPGSGRTRSSTNNNGILGAESGPKVTKDNPATPEGKKWKGWGTALKPAHEPIVVARKPLIATVAENVLKHGTGALNIDACRVPTDADDAGGRWPANLIHDGSDEVLAEFAKYGDKGNGWKRNYGEENYLGRQYGGGCFAGGGYAGGSTYCDSGTAARFFYCAKASKKDRGDGNDHPTVKPTDLMRYLVRLVTPSGGTVLDPFMGSGSTGKACASEGFKFVGIEKERPYLEIAKRRIENEYALAV